MANDNRTLGRFMLDGILPAPRGLPQIEVTFDIDANSIVNVSAKDLGTGKVQSMVITGGSALPKDEIDRMMREAEQYAEDDHRRREEAEVRNQAESLVYSTEKFLKDNEDKVPGDVKSEVEAAIGETKEALKSEDSATIRSASEKLATTSQKLGAALYQQAQASGEATGAPGGEGAGASGGAEDDVVDAEIVDEGKGGQA